MTHDFTITFDQRQPKRLVYKVPRPVPRFWKRRARQMYWQWVRKEARRRLSKWMYETLCPPPLTY